jgi:glutaredoxin
VITLTIYSRPGCHLCDEMKGVVQRTLQRLSAAVRVEEIDISTDPDLEARYGMEIPVLLVDGKKAAKYRVTEWELTRMLNARTERPAGPGGSGGSGGPGGSGGSGG